MYESEKARIKSKNFSKKRDQIRAAMSMSKIRGPMNRRLKKRTWPEKETQNILEELGLKYEIEKPLQFKNGWKYYDIFLEEYGILIEVDGDYWHGNTMSKDKNSIMIQIKNKQNDAIKNFVAKNNDYMIIRIKENDLKENRDKVKDNILKEIDKRKGVLNENKRN